MVSSLMNILLQNLCQSVKDCEWFNWSNFTISDGEKWSTRCYLKSGKGKAKAKSGVTTGPKYCVSETSCIEHGKLYIGHGFNYWQIRKNNFGGQKSAAKCQVRKSLL